MQTKVYRHGEGDYELTIQELDSRDDENGVWVEGHGMTAELACDIAEALLTQALCALERCRARLAKKAKEE